MSVRILIGDCRSRMAALDPDSVDSCVTDPPYHLTSIVKRFGAANAAPAKVGKTGAYARASRGFMGQTWDGGDVAFDPETWAAVLRVLKPGAHLVAFSGTRTYHRMACAIEDAGFEIRDQLAWVYGSGFPKSHDVSKGIDKMLGAKREVIGRNPNWRDPEANAAHHARWNAAVISGDLTEPGSPEAAEWEGWGTALKPAWEPICLARKPLQGTVAGNVLKHGTGAINIDGCRIEADGRPHRIAAGDGRDHDLAANINLGSGKAVGTTDLGRWPANIIHDGSEEVLAGFPESDGSGPERTLNRNAGLRGGDWGMNAKEAGASSLRDAGSGSAARFFYCAKATSAERGDGNNHPTVKPVALMQWLCRLVTPKGGLVLDPFAGSGSTLIAAQAEQFDAIGCELSPEYAAIAEGRVRTAGGLFADILFDQTEAAA